METATKQSIEAILRTNDRAVEKAILVLFRNQTREEQALNSTNVHNQKGFTASDAHWGSIHAKTLLRGGRLADWQLRYWRNPVRGKPRIARYWRQLLIAAEEKAAQKVMRHVA